MAGPGPAIHAFAGPGATAHRGMRRLGPAQRASARKAWMAGPRPAMAGEVRRTAFEDV